MTRDSLGNRCFHCAQHFCAKVSMDETGCETRTVRPATIFGIALGVIVAMLTVAWLWGASK